MISETLPLNEWPSEDLKALLFIIDVCFIHSPEVTSWDCMRFKPVVKQAIKDAEEREQQLNF